MDAINAQNRSPQFSKESQNSKPETRGGCLGTFPRSSSQHGAYKVGAGREDSSESNIFIPGQHSNTAVPGKIVSQLIQETEKQLAYYEQQAEVLRVRLQELKEIPIDKSQ